MDDLILSDRYQIQERIGEGATAEVYRAIDLTLDRPVAVKILRSQFAADPRFRARFLDEARNAARLAHPNIVAIYDVVVGDEAATGPQAGMHYIVMELVEGPSLRDLIAAEAPLPPERAIELATQILAAVGYAHQRGLVHRDIKPANVLLTRDGQAKVADFGIAAAANTHQPGETGVVVGTALYISPEQATGQPATASSDLYAVGVVLFEMLTGRLPFEGATALAVALQHVQAPVPSARALNPRISPGLDALLRRALAKDPANRFSTATAFTNEIQSSLRLGLQQTSALPVVNRPAARARETGAPARPQQRSVDWFAILVGVLVFAAFIGAVPLAAGVYRLYQSNQPTPVPTVGLIQVPSPTATVEAIASPTPELVTPSPTLEPTPTQETMVQVPNVVGRTVEEAQAMLEQAGFITRIIEQTATPDQEPDVVVAQSIAPDTTAREGDTIDLTVARMPESGIVPNVVGRSRAEAEALIHRARLGVQFSEEFSNDMPVGLVIRQRPGPGEQVAPLSVVQIVVSRGPQPPPPTPTPVPAPQQVTVPNLVGRHQNDARQIVEALGLQLAPIHYQAEDDVEDKEFFRTIGVGHVLSQLQQPGTQVPVGSAINIAVRRE